MILPLDQPITTPLSFGTSYSRNEITMAQKLLLITLKWPELTQGQRSAVSNTIILLAELKSTFEDTATIKLED